MGMGTEMGTPDADGGMGDGGWGVGEGVAEGGPREEFAQRK